LDDNCETMYDLKSIIIFSVYFSQSHTKVAKISGKVGVLFENGHFKNVQN